MREDQIEAMARACHEANRAYCMSRGDASQLPWDYAPEWQKQSAVQGVKDALSGMSPEELHESWMRLKLAQGWTHGGRKDAAKQTHPCLVPYDELPPEQRAKDYIFAGVVKAMGAGFRVADIT